MLAFDWLEQTDKIGCHIFPARMTSAELCMLPDCLETLSSTLCQSSALKEAIGQFVYDISIFLKWGILNIPFCSIFVPFCFYLMTLVVPCLDNIFLVLLISELEKVVRQNLFLDSGSAREGRGLCACVGLVCYHCIVQILNSSKKLYFLCF